MKLSIMLTLFNYFAFEILHRNKMNIENFKIDSCHDAAAVSSVRAELINSVHSGDKNAAFKL